MTWKTHLTVRVALFCGSLILALANVAHGQSATAADGAKAATALTPPKLAHFAEAVYPAAQVAAGQGANVDLEITISATGAVTNVVAVNPTGSDFDTAAIAAARQFVFEPAHK